MICEAVEEPQAESPRTDAHPSVYMVLVLPFGLVGGFITVTLAYLLVKGGATVGAVAAVAGLSILPNTWKVLWAPLVDTTLTAKRWHVLSVAACGLGLFATAFVPVRAANVSLFGVISIALVAASTIAGMAGERIMAHCTPERRKGAAGGWSQAGNLGGTGLGGGVGLWIAQHSGHPWAAGALLGCLCLPCSLALIGLSEPLRPERRTYAALLAATASDVWSLVRTRLGLLALFILLLPMGTGALQGLWAALGPDWGASADVVALVGGAISGVVGIIGCVLGGYLADRIDRKRSYAIAGLIMAACTAGMALAPRNVATFLLFTSVYNLIVGVAYGAYAAVVLEAIGRGAAATKFNLLSSVSNVPIMLVTFAEGWAHGHGGATSMLWCETAVGVLAVVFYSAVAASTRSWRWPLRRWAAPAA